jgi:hypothetical protein
MEARIASCLSGPKRIGSGTEKVTTSKAKRIYAPRIVSDHIMEEEWPELVYKLPPKALHSG